MHLKTMQVGGGVCYCTCARELVREPRLSHQFSGMRVGFAYLKVRRGSTVVITCQHVMLHIEIVMSQDHAVQHTTKV